MNSVGREGNDKMPRDGRWPALVAAFLGWMFDGLEMGIFPLVARPALQEMLGSTHDAAVGLWMGRITALFLVGAALGGLGFGWLGDRVGRVRAMAASILTYSVFTGLLYFAANPWQLGAFRFIAALGMGGEWALGVALVMEVWPADRRPLLAGVIGASANLGMALVACLGIGFSVTQESWRWVVVVGAAPALLTFLIRLWVPESGRWEESVAKRETLGSLREVFGARLRRVMLLGTTFAAVTMIGTWGSVQWLPLWADQLTSGRLPEAKAWTQTFSAVGAVFGCLLGAWLGGRVGRRQAYFWLCLGSLLACAFLFRGQLGYGAGFLTMTFVVGAITASFFGWLPLYLPELFPTRVRATAQGLAFNAGRLVAAVGALQTGALMQTFDGDYARAGAVMSLIYVVGMVTIWWAPETKDRPLPP
jgi:MFS family permease